MNMCDKPIGVFDSGVGGITVLKELYTLMPNEDYIYFGDSLNAPYGNKSDEEIEVLSEKAIKKLCSLGVKAVVIACNTATSVAVTGLREKLTLPIIGIEPAVKPAAKAHPGKKIIVMATPVTLKNNKFLQLAQSYNKIAKIIPLPCPGLAQLIESGKDSKNDIVKYLHTLFAAYLDNPPSAIVLGCTHYPHISGLIKDLFEHDVEIFDGGFGTARETKRQLEELSLLNPKKEKGYIEFISSVQTDVQVNLMKKLFDSFEPI